MAKRTFRKSGPAFQATPQGPEPLPNCMKKILSYGFWGGGYRYVCYRVSGDGMILELDTYQQVAGL